MPLSGSELGSPAIYAAPCPHRANHITVRGCTFTRNGSGISIGTRDCYNHIDTCAVEDNSGPGVLIRKSPAPTEVHSCLVSECKIAGSATKGGRGQVEMVSDAHDLVFVDNEVAGSTQLRKAGFFVESSVRRPSSDRRSVVEEPHSRGHHHHAVLIRCRGDFLIHHRPTRLDDVFHPTASGAVDVVPEREVGI